MRTVQVLLLLFCVQPSFSAPFRFSDRQQQAYFHYFRLQFVQAAECLQAEKEWQAGLRDDINGATVYLEDLGDFLQLLTTEDVARFRLISSREDERLDLLAQLDKNSPYYLYAQAEVRLRWAMLKLLFGEQLAGAWAVKKAYAMLRENEAKYPDFLPNQKSLGLLRVMLGAVPAKYQWLTGLVGLSGDTATGLRDLWQVAQSSDLHAQEAMLAYLLAKTYFLGEANTAADLGHPFWEKQATNPSVAFVGALVLLKAERASQAKALLARCPAAAYFPLMHYISGNVHLLAGDYAGANAAYQHFLANYLGQNARKDALYKLFLGHWLGGLPGAEHYLKRCREEGATNTEADRHALRFAGAPRWPAPALMRARLLTDGGEYAQAWQVLQAVSPAQLAWDKDQLEYLYRSGRVRHKLGQAKEALRFYDQAITTQAVGQPYYFAPSAALQAGYLCRDSLNNPAKASEYFAKALTYRGHEYEQSIRQKAKLALAQLGE
jgi:tetratricopeptide (TPR) repeat protein